MNVTLFGNRVFVDVIKLRSYWIRIDPKSNDWRSYEKGGIWIQRQRHRGKALCEDKGREWSAATVNQGMPRVVGNHQKLEEQEGFF